MTYWNPAAVEECECGYVATDSADYEWHFDSGRHAMNDHATQRDGQPVGDHGSQRDGMGSGGSDRG